MLLSGSCTLRLLTKNASTVKHPRKHLISFFSTETNNNATKRLIYASPNMGLVKLVKRFSLTTLGLTALATPTVMCYWDTPAVQAADMSSTMFLGESLINFVSTQFMITTAVAASACSTGVLTYILAPYIDTIYLHENDLHHSTATKEGESHSEPKSIITPNSTITIETMDILTRRRTTTLKIRELVPVPDSSFLTWRVNKQVLKKQQELEQMRGIKPRIQQHKFWLDQRNLLGDVDTMSNILRLVNEQRQQQRLI